MKKLPIGIQTFEKIRKDDFIYVDKTRLIYELTRSGTYYFFTRPRRFGKSLLLTTLKSFFLGKKELFKDLYIFDKEKEWTFHPVIHIDYSKVNYRDTKEVFRSSMIFHLKAIAAEYQVSLEEKDIATAFNELLLKLYQKYQQRVVVLVDEYDKPLVDSLTKPEVFERNRLVLNSLYGSMKGHDDYLRFVLLTGVSRFSKVSVFSGMNNLDDISMNKTYSTLVGFTQNELETYFQAHLEKLAHTFSKSVSEILTPVKEWYNGFSFDGVNQLYNPFSILKLFTEFQFRNYWFSTGTPTFLIDLIKKQKQLPEAFEHKKVSDLEGSTQHIDKFPLIPLLYQTGYLTIEKIELDDFRPIYYLNYPNEEVRYSMRLILESNKIFANQ
jgi:hypothetical protein